MASTGTYRVVLEVDGQRLTQTFEVQSDPNFVGVTTGTETGGEDFENRAPATGR